MATTAEQFARYGRQMLLPEIGPGGQALLEQADVYFTGDATSADIAARYLVAAGVGGVGGVVDFPALRELRDDLRSVASSQEGTAKVRTYDVPASDPVSAWVQGPKLALRILREIIGAPLSLVEELEREIG